MKLVRLVEILDRIKQLESIQWDRRTKSEQKELNDLYKLDLKDLIND